MKPHEIKEIRKALELTQEEFAREVGVAFATVSRWENGHKNPSALALKVLEKLQRKATKAEA